MQYYTKTGLSLIFGVVVLSCIITFIPQKAFGDGFTQENVQATIGNRVITTFIKLSPPIITSDTSSDKFIFLRFFDANTNTTINNVEFFVNVTKGNDILMHDLFYTKSGFMILKLQPGNCENAVCTVYGDQNPTLGGWMSQDDEVSILSSCDIHPPKVGF